MKASPMPFTQREIEALAAGDPATIARRLRSNQAATRKVTAASARDKSAPQPVSRKDLRAIQAGRFPADLKRRIEARAQPEAQGRVYPGEEKAAPTSTPSRAYAKPRRMRK